MWKWAKELDRILRGEATSLSVLRREPIRVPIGGLSGTVVVLGMVYGLCMGCYAIFGSHGPVSEQLVASTLKVPVLFFLTLLVTFPSLYVFNALVGSRLTAQEVLRLLIAALAVNLAVLASLGPIVAFFSVNTTSYPFMVLLNVVVFALSGALGLSFLLQTLHRLSIAQRQTPPLARPEETRPEETLPEETLPEETPPEETLPGNPAEDHQGESPPPLDGAESDSAVKVELVEEPGALDRIEGHMLGKHVKTVFGCWVVVFGLVGAQMGWVLRPFIGNPKEPFAWFRPKGSNFFEAVVEALRQLLS